MPYQAFETAATLIVVWQRPEMEDVGAIVAKVRAAKRGPDGKLSYVAYIPDAIKAPEMQVRSAMVRSIKSILEHCDHLHFILEGTGFGPSVGRSVMAGIILAAGQRGRILIHASIDDAAGHLAGDAVLKLRELQRQHLTDDVDRVAPADHGSAR